MYRSAELKKREKLLSEILQLLEKMAVQIRYRALPLGDLFIELQGGVFMDEVLKNSDSNWRNSWNKAVSQFTELDDGDRELLISIGNSLGGSDAAGQTAMLELNRELLSARLKTASETAAKKGAMYRSVGVMVGLGLAVMVI